jgi:hypothetical protein
LSFLPRRHAVQRALARRALGKTTLTNPTNMSVGQSDIIAVKHSGAARTLSYGSYWKFPKGTTLKLSEIANTVDYFSYYVESASRISECNELTDCTGYGYGIGGIGFFNCNKSTNCTGTGKNNGFRDSKGLWNNLARVFNANNAYVSCSVALDGSGPANTEADGWNRTELDRRQ